MVACGAVVLDAGLFSVGVPGVALAGGVAGLVAAGGVVADVVSGGVMGCGSGTVPGDDGITGVEGWVVGVGVWATRGRFRSWNTSVPNPANKASVMAPTMMSGQR